MVTRLATALLTALLLAGCNAEDDLQMSYQHTIQVGLYSLHTRRDTALTQFQAWGVGREDTLLIDQGVVSSFFLNVNMGSDHTDFVLRTQTLQDDVHFDYATHPKPVSGIAGVAMEVELTGVTHTKTFIDSAEVREPWIRYNENVENVALYVY